MTKIPGTGLDEPMVLVSVETNESSEAMSDLLADGCGLTETEAALLKLFLEGRQFAEIAEIRNRSTTTIRNQMQSIFEKTGCASQSELMRLGYSLTIMVGSIGTVLETRSRPHRRRFDLLRDSGRTLSVEMAGSPTGQVVISLPSLFGHALTPAIEQQFALADIRMLCVSKPGTGKTDTPANGMSTDECVARDIEAVLDQVGAERCILMGRASNAYLIFLVAGLIPHRIERACVVNGVMPKTFEESAHVASQWTRSLIEAARRSPALAGLILRSGRRLMQLLGSKRFIARMYENSPVDVALTEDPDVLESIEIGSLMTTEQGFEEPSRDMIRAMSDWSDYAKSCPHKITLFQGAFDPNVSQTASTRFAQAFPDACDLHLVEDGGGLMNYSHVPMIVDWIKRGTTPSRRAGSSSRTGSLRPLA
ncbi:LuxR C-terminal-related transcriptional regulator [Pseudahrensia aquimaris]|uniref:LuxR C-terminal-related transcriptional regulator n=1 Tax=Pseudahrensia aquimaris TaxID=744461 RepID=A0ABW3FCL5_9HYPH